MITTYWNSMRGPLHTTNQVNSKYEPNDFYTLDQNNYFFLSMIKTQTGLSKSVMQEVKSDEQLRIDKIKLQMVKNIRRKNLEVIIEKQILQHQSDRQSQNQAEMNNAMNALKTLTLSIILRVAGKMFQSVVSLGSCIVFIVSCYQDSGNEYRYINIIVSRYST